MRKVTYKMGFTIEAVVDHWDRVAPVYDHANSHKLNPHHWRFIEGIKHVNLSTDSKNIRVASIWSRTGDAIPYIRTKLPNATVYNLEASSEMMKVAKRKYPNESFMKTDLSTISLESESVDYIMSHETLEHTPEPQRMIREFFRVLKPHGRLILSLPPRIADFHQWVYETFVGGHGDGPRKGIPSKIVKAFLREGGFNIDTHKAILLFPIGPVWFIELGNKILARFPVLRELGVMQFYICSKPVLTESSFSRLS